MRALALLAFLALQGCTTTSDAIMVCFWGCVIEDQAGSTDATATTEEETKLEADGL